MDLDYNKKYSMSELSSMDAISVYKVILYGKFNKKFPNRFWEGKDGKERACKIVNWLVCDHLNLSEEDLSSINLWDFFKSHNLNGMLTIVFGGVAFDAIRYAIPNKFRLWKFKRVPNSYWNRDKAIEATVGLISELGYSDNELKHVCSFKLFKDNNLGGMLQKIYNSSAINAIMDAYPNRFKVWEFNNVPKSFWVESNGVEATRWLVEEKLKLSDEELKNSLSCNMFEDNGLTGMLCELYDYSPYKAISSAYPNKFTESDFKNKPRRFWSD